MNIDEGGTMGFFDRKDKPVKQSLIIEKDYQTVNMDYSETRVKAYEKILQIWKNSEKAALLSIIINNITPGDQRNIPAEKCRSILKKLDKTNIISLVEVESNFFTSRYKIVVNDPEFLNQLFYKKTGSGLLQLAQLKVFSTYRKDNVETSRTKEVEAKRFLGFCPT